MKKVVDLPNIDNKSRKKVKKRSSTKSHLYADSLFSFTDKLEHLFEYLEKGFIPIRYYAESIGFLKIRGFGRVAIPMKCFCDIKLHSIKQHVEWYGFYGIAFSKEWGIEKGMQPVHYINTRSFLSKDYSFAFKEAKKKKNQEYDLPANDYLLEHLLFMKPNKGKMWNNNTNTHKEKCFTDECEWRFISDVTRRGYRMFYNMKYCDEGFIEELNKSLKKDKDSGIVFDYDDIKYLIVKNKSDCNKTIDLITKKIHNQDVKNRLISKILVWEECKEDF